MNHSLLLRQPQLFTDGVADMGFEETGNSHRPLVVQPKVPNWAVDGWVCQLEQPVFLHTLKVNHQHLSARNFMCPMAEGIQDGLVVLRNRNKSIVI